MKADLTQLALSVRGSTPAAESRTPPRASEAADLPAQQTPEPAPVPLPGQAVQSAASIAAAAAAAVAQANQHLQKNGRELTIEFNDDLGRSIFKLVDSVTGEVLRQIPSEEALAVARALAAGQGTGSFLDAQV